MTLEGPRVLEKMFDGAHVLVNPEEPYYVLTGNNWGALDDTHFVSRSYYDLSGYNRDSLTSFFQGVDIQDAYAPTGTMNGFILIELISNERPTDAELLAAAASLAADNQPPGYPSSTTDMQTIVYGRQRQYFLDTAWSTGGFPRMVGISLWGTNAATTADKIHLTRLLVTTQTAGQQIRIPPSNFVTTIIVAEEKELAFLMRQKRSHELASGP